MMRLKNHGTLELMSEKIVTGFIAVAALLTGLQVSHAKPAISDGFETKSIDTSIWSLRNMPNRRHWMDKTHKRTGKKSLAIRVKGYDIDKRCNCQVSEIREASKTRIKFGEEVWYSFSFLVKGRGGITSDTRWQIASWKQETDGSPYLAQRFDNGVFHITLESGKSRVLIATAAGKPEGFISAMSKGLMSQFGFLSQKDKYDGDDDITLAYGEHPILPNPQKGWVDMMYHIKGGLNDDGFIEIFANGNFVARATGTIGIKDFSGPTQYFRFGHNRAAMPGTATLYFDNFKRGSKRIDVEKRD